MKQMFLHIGTHRTGTTSVQKYFRDNLSLLRDNGVKYDEWGYYTSQVLNAHAPLNADRIRLHKCYPEVEEYDKIVWSSEGFFGHHWKGYSNIGLVAHDLGVLLKDIDTTVIAVIRNREEYLKSLFWLYKKMIGKDSWEEFYTRMSAFPLRWDELLDEYRKVFDKVLVFKYEGLDVINTMLDVIGTTVRNTKEYRENESD